MGCSTLGWSTTAQTCACGVHVHKGALIVGILMLIAHIIKSMINVQNMINGTHYLDHEMEGEVFEKMKAHAGPATTVSTLMLHVVGILVTVSMIYGNRTQRRLFVRPFIIYKKINCWLLIGGGIFLSTSAFDLVAAVILLILRPRQNASTAFQYMVLAANFLPIGIVKLYFCVVVVKRSYNLMSPLDEIA